MTPAARYAAAIAVLDQIVGGGAPAERVLTQWARGNRFAGSGDRAAIRDHVYDVLRARQSLAALGGGETGRHLILGLLRRDGPAPETVFGAGGHAPAALTAAEIAGPKQTATPADSVDVPDWLWPQWTASLKDAALAAARVQQQRAPLHLRVNLSRTDRVAAQASLRDDVIAAVPHPEVETALTVTENPRRVAASRAFRGGLVEVQDAASQIAIARLPLDGRMRVLDYCAGGGGKALAIADRIGRPVWAHDIDPGRMGDIGPRATRAGVDIKTLATRDLPAAGPFDLVFCDAPCSGSGTWRRTPDAKWRLTPERLDDLTRIQDDVLRRAAALTQAGGLLAYATCSVLTAENDDRIAAFLAAFPGWTLVETLRLIPDPAHDGFYLAILRRP